MKGTSVDAVIGALVLAVVGLALLGTVLDFSNTASVHPNATATQKSLILLVPTFFVIGLVVATIFLLMKRKAGGF